jgi:substrate-binding family protein
MGSGVLHLLAGTVVAIALSATSASAQKKYDTGASDTEIKIGQTVPFSGPASAYAGIGKTQAAYMRMINEQGGINGRKLNLIQYDDAYSPPKAVEQVRKLVEGDEVLFTSRSSARRRMPPFRNISTARRCRSCWPRPARRNSPTRRTFPGRWATIPTTSPRGASTGNTF